LNYHYLIKTETFMIDKTLEISELSAKIFNLLNYLEQNCIRLVEINCKIISDNKKNQNAIKINIDRIAAVLNRIFNIKEELETILKEQIIDMQNNEPAVNYDNEILKSLKTLETKTTEIMDKTYYVNQNGKIIK